MMPGPFATPTTFNTSGPPERYPGQRTWFSHMSWTSTCQWKYIHSERLYTRRDGFPRWSHSRPMTLFAVLSRVTNQLRLLHSPVSRETEVASVHSCPLDVITIVTPKWVFSLQGPFSTKKALTVCSLQYFVRLCIDKDIRFTNRELISTCIGRRRGLSAHFCFINIA